MADGYNLSSQSPTYRYTGHKEMNDRLFKKKCELKRKLKKILVSIQRGSCFFSKILRSSLLDFQIKWIWYILLFENNLSSLSFPKTA